MMVLATWRLGVGPAPVDQLPHSARWQGCTVRKVLACAFPLVAVMLVIAEAGERCPVAKPVASMVAIVSFSDVHATGAPAITLPAESFTVA